MHMHIKVRKGGHFDPAVCPTVECLEQVLGVEAARMGGGVQGIDSIEMHGTAGRADMAFWQAADEHWVMEDESSIMGVWSHTKDAPQGAPAVLSQPTRHAKPVTVRVGNAVFELSEENAAILAQGVFEALERLHGARRAFDGKKEAF